MLVQRLIRSFSRKRAQNPLRPADLFYDYQGENYHQDLKEKEPYYDIHERKYLKFESIIFYILYS